MVNRLRAIFIPHKLNSDQLTEVAKLSFDLAKAAFIVAILPTFNTNASPLTTILTTVLAIFWGLAFTYLGLLFLERKGQQK